MLREAREQTGMSLECAAYGLHMDRRTLARIEQAANPAEQSLVLSMARVYGQENLPLRYCAQRCPIGRQCGYELPADGLAGAVLRYVKEAGEAAAIQMHLLQDACKGELEELLVKELLDVQRAVFALQIAAGADGAKKRTPDVTSIRSSLRSKPV